MVERKSFSKTPENISGELVTKNYGCEPSIFISLPVIQMPMPEVNQILLKNQTYFFVCVRPTSKPPFHHFWGHIRIPIPFELSFLLRFFIFINFIFIFLRLLGWLFLLIRFELFFIAVKICGFFDQFLPRFGRLNSLFVVWFYRLFRSLISWFLLILVLILLQFLFNLNFIWRFLFLTLLLNLWLFCF